jgi:RNA polymerase sigma-70 factor (ECF subfamily)
LRAPSADPRAWTEFVERYNPLVYRWCLHWRLQEADALDVCQSVLARLVVRLREIQYDPRRSFRAYLKTITRYTCQDLIQERLRAGEGAGDTAHLDLLAGIEARDDLARRLDEEYDRELLALAAERVRARVEPHTWEAFQLTSVEGVAGAEAAERLGLSVFVVFKARSKVRKMLRDEVARLGEEDAGGEPADEKRVDT